MNVVKKIETRWEGHHENFHSEWHSISIQGKLSSSEGDFANLLSNDTATFIISCQNIVTAATKLGELVKNLLKEEKPVGQATPTPPPHTVATGQNLPLDCKECLKSGKCFSSTKTNCVHFLLQV